MNRRSFLEGSTAFSALAMFGQAARAQTTQSGSEASAASMEDLVLEEARRLAAAPYQPPSTDLPDDYDLLTYWQYRDIGFASEATIWAAEPTPFRLGLFHRGLIYKEPVGISLVEDGEARRIPFSTNLFHYGPSVWPPVSAGPDFDFSGFRAATEINAPGVWQEFLVFQGASYFRAVARDQIYGLSARGLAINTAAPEGEEFPAFRHFWIEKPAPDAASLVAHALLDSPSTTGAYRFEFTPGAETVFDVKAALFPRTEIKKVGLAPLTSMFLFNALDRVGVDDFRGAVHDSDGLQMLTGAGEWLWRPLSNPQELQISSFMDTHPLGFGLMQRARRYEDFEDLEAEYERRPSLWIEPLGDWGEGAVELVEIPTAGEHNDNIVAYWRPNAPMPAGGPWRLAYRMRWTDIIRPHDLLWTISSRSGRAPDRQRRLFVVDFAGTEETRARLTGGLSTEISASHGEIVSPAIHDDDREGMVRVSFELAPGSEPLSELRLRLNAGAHPASETWLYRWTRQ